VEKGDCAYFPSLLAEMSRPVGTAQVGPINSLLRSIERKARLFRCLWCWALAVSSWILLAERLDYIDEVGIGFE
jgi:hypothetical protein